MLFTLNLLPLMKKLFAFFFFFFLVYLPVSAQNYQQLGKTYDRIEWDYDNVLRVASGEKYGLIDLQGNEILTPQYGSIGFFYGEYAIAELDGNQSVINQKGKVLYTNTQYEELEIFGQNLLRVRQGRKYGLITFEDKVVFPIDYRYISNVGDGFVMAAKDQSRAALFNLAGKQITDFLYQNAGGFADGLLNVATEYDKWGLIDTEGKVVIPINYELLSFFGEGLFTFSKGNKSGFMDKTGKVVFEGNYESIDGFSEGLAFARGEKFSVFIDQTGKQVIKDKFYFYEIPSIFENGSAIVQPAKKKDYLLGLIDKQGNTLLDFNYTWIESQVNGYYVGTHQDGKRTDIINAQGKIVASFQFSDNTSLSNLHSVGQNGVPLFILTTEEGVKLILVR